MDDPRPKTRPPLGGIDIAIEALALALVLAGLGYAALTWPSLPPTVAIHFGLDGRPDGWGPKASLLFLPFTTLGLYLLLSLVARHPWSSNYAVPLTADNAMRQYRLGGRLLRFLKAELALTFGWIEIATMTGSGGAAGLGPLFPAVCLVTVFATVAVYISASFKAR